MANPDISVKITADASGFAKGAAIVQGSLAKLETQMSGLQAVAAKSLSGVGLTSISVAATAAAAGLIAATKAAADYGDQLDAMSQRTGVAVEDLAKLQYAAQLSDTSAEALGKGLTVLSTLMAGAAAGAAGSSALFEKYGIALRNSDGSVRGSSDVLGDLAEVFSNLPDGVQRTALAVEFFGKKVGPELIPLLLNGRDGLKALGDEAERLGLVMSKEQTAAAAAFNDNLDRLAALSKSTGIAIGNELIPWVNKMVGEMNAAAKSSDGFWMSFLKWPLGISEVQKTRDAAENIALLTKRIDILRAAVNSGKSDSLYGFDDGKKDELAKLEAERAEYIKLQSAKTEESEKESAAKRLTLATQLAGKLKELEQLRAIDSGKASADILKSDKELNAARLKDAEKLRDALRGAYENSTKEAKSAAEEAIKLLDKAKAKRASGADKALDASLADATEEEKATAYGDKAQSLFDQGRYFAAAAGAAKLDGRLQEMEGYAKQADEFLARAESFAGKSGDSGLTQGIAEAQAQILEAQAAAKQQEAKALEDRAAAQMQALNEVEAKINQIVSSAAKFEIKADLTQLEADVARIKAEIAKGAVMPVAIQPNQAASADINSAGLGGFEGGGFTGWYGRKAVAGFVHGQEYVTPANVTLQPGVIPFLEALRRHGNKILPGYEKGGLVTSVPSGGGSLSSRAGSTVNLSLDGRSFQMQASADVAALLVDQVRREALRKGGRR